MVHPQTPCTATATGAGGLNVTQVTVVYSNNTNAGTATADARPNAGDANHNGSTATPRSPSPSTKPAHRPRRCHAARLGRLPLHGTSQHALHGACDRCGSCRPQLRLPVVQRTTRTAGHGDRELHASRAMPTTQAAATAKHVHDRQGSRRRPSVTCTCDTFTYNGSRADTLLGRRDGCGQP